MGKDILFRQYLKKDRVDYAILINGEWGVGKTYYYETKLKKIIEEEGKKSIRVSLYGKDNINSILDDITYSILQETINVSKLESSLPKIKELNTKLKGIPSALGNTILRKGYGMFSGFMKEKSTIDSIFDVYDDFNNIVLVFDDFERCKINIIELLGFISSFLEKGNLKIIVIANENEIINVQNIDKLEERYNFALSLHNLESITKAGAKNNENNKVAIDRNYLTEKVDEFFNTLDQYKKMKEKVFGYTITIKNNIENLYDSIIDEYKNNYYLYNILKENKKLILEIYSYIKSNNLRILKRSFDSLESIFNESDIKLKEIKSKEIKSDIEKSIISFSIIIYNTINLNYINFDSSVRECETSEIKFSYGKKNDYFVYIYENFVQRMKNKVNIIHFKSILEFIIDGEISQSKLNEDIDICKEILLLKKVDYIQKDKRDIAEKLLDFDIMSENEFTSNFNLFVSNVKKGIYHTKCYKKILQIILMLRKNNLINYEINNIESLLKDQLLNYS